jgi:hypothetical protein
MRPDPPFASKSVLMEDLDKLKQPASVLSREHPPVVNP